MAKVSQKQFAFTMPFTTRRNDGNGRLRPEHRGNLHIEGTGFYDSEQSPEYALNYDLKVCSFTRLGAKQEMPLGEWAGGTMMNLQDAHLGIIHHLKKIFCLEETDDTCRPKVVDIVRDRTEAIIHVHYKDSFGVKHEETVREELYEEWIRAKDIARSLRSYWPSFSTQMKMEHFSLYLADTLQTEEALAKSNAVAA
jgi:hypothetical protein